MLVPSYNWKACPMTWGNLWVEPNGDIYNCYGFDYVVGNVFRDSPLLAFNSKKQREFRKKLLTVNPPLRQCHSCNFAREGWQIHGGYITRALTFLLLAALHNQLKTAMFIRVASGF